MLLSKSFTRCPWYAISPVWKMYTTETIIVCNYVVFGLLRSASKIPRDYIFYVADAAHLLPPADEVWGKVIFLQLFVILFTGGVSREGGPPRRRPPPGRRHPPEGEPPLERGTPPPWRENPPPEGGTLPEGGTPEGGPPEGGTPWKETTPPRRRHSPGRRIPQKEAPPWKETLRKETPRKEAPPWKEAQGILLECILVY